MIKPEAVVLLSGGIGSYAAARRYIDKNATKYVTLLFTDTLIEDEDVYRFLDDAVADLVEKSERREFVRLADGRTPWKVFNDEGFIGNTRVDICSRVLKRELSRKWIEENLDEGSDVVVGFDFTEVHRFERAAPRWKPWNLVAPLCDKPYLSKPDNIANAKKCGLIPPRQYEMGFAHANCGGFCVKQGQAAFAHLLRIMPERYKEHEKQEEAFRESTGHDVAIMRDRRGGETRPITMKDFRLRIEQDTSGQDQLFDADDWGGCGCMVGEGNEG